MIERSRVQIQPSQSSFWGRQMGITAAACTKIYWSLWGTLRPSTNLGWSPEQWRTGSEFSTGHVGLKGTLLFTNTEGFKCISAKGAIFQQKKGHFLHDFEGAYRPRATAPEHSLSLWSLWWKSSDTKREKLRALDSIINWALAESP